MAGASIPGYKSTPLNDAAFHCDHKAVRRLLEGEEAANVNAQDSRGRTMLHYTLMKKPEDCTDDETKAKLKHGRKTTIQVILKNGGDTNIADNDGKRPPDVAKELGFRLLAMLMAPTESTQDLLDKRLNELQSTTNRLRQYRQRRENRRKLRL